MIISHNLASLNTYRHVAANANQAAKSLEKLSSGMRINRAGDDAAGLAISEKMRGQIRGLGQAQRNAQDAISMIQTAEGAASSIHDMLQRGRELAVQASNGTLTDSDRTSVNDEVQQILSQIDNVANNTEFNTIKMLNQGSLSGISQAVIDDLQAKVPLWIDDALSNISTNLGITFPALRDMTVKLYQNPSETRAAYMATSDGGATLELGLNLSKLLDGSNQIVADSSGGQFDTVIAHEIVHALQYNAMSSVLGGGIANDEMWFVEGLATAIQGGNGFLTPPNHNATVSLASWGGTASDYGAAFAAVKTLHEITVGGIQAFVDRMEAGDTIDQAFANTTQAQQGEFSNPIADFANAASFTSWFNTNADVDTYLDTSTDFTVGTGSIDGSAAGATANLSQANTIANDGSIDNPGVYNITFDTTSEPKKFSIQIGANSGQSMDIDSVDITSTGLGIGSVDLTLQSSAETAISTFDGAIQKVSSVRSYYGAVQNRLEHTIANLANAEENLTAAESRIRDVDMAKEMMNFQKYNILTQAAQAMLAQANQQPQGVLQLLR